MDKAKTLHVVTFHEPFPPNFGGVIDVFYKLVAFKKQGIDIILHVFTDKNEIDVESLKLLVKQVFIYKRKKAFLRWIEGNPYSVFSRFDSKLLKNISGNDPIFFEGLQTTAVLKKLRLTNRKVFIRMHNVEWQYYQNIATYETRFLKKVYLARESYLLKQYEAQVIKKADAIFSISNEDEVYFKEVYPNLNTYYVPPFHAYTSVLIPKGKGNSVLYHGNLGISENEHMALLLISNSSHFKLPLIIAGKNPSNTLQSKVKESSNVQLVANPDDSKMNQLMHDAHIHIVAGAQKSGVKLKMINALFSARHIITNEHSVYDEQCKSFCIIENDLNKYADIINSLIDNEASPTSLEDRISYLETSLSNEHNCQLILQQIFP